ncbi:MAG: hypothetical protein CM1200mP39_28630 [Dehalococcoidia bacterium]|nr:MAG: hypothetical protein CM1200mP39_28630 [Dehalococcoidia bacterium]
MYTPEEFDEAAMVMKHIGQTGTDAMAGIEALSDVSAQYESKVEYADDPLSQSLRGIAQVHLAGIGTRVFYANMAAMTCMEARYKPKQNYGDRCRVPLTIFSPTFSNTMQMKK